MLSGLFLMDMQKSRPWFFYLCALEGAVAIAALLSIPSEGGHLSPARLALVGFILVLCFGWIYLGLRRQETLPGMGRSLYLYLCVLACLVLALLLFFLRYYNPDRFLSIYERLSPLLWYLFILAIQFSFLFLLSSRGFHPSNITSRKPIYVSAFTAFCLLFALFLFIAMTRLGLTPDPAYWSEPGVPILGWQFGLALLGGLGILLINFSAYERILDSLLPFGIYFLALLIWLSVPVGVLKNSFYMPIDPQTSQPFPYSDAGYYDQMAESLLIGHPYQGEIPTRPLYIFLLTVLHLVFGENYRNIILGQTVVLAVVPVIFYYLGKKLHSRAAGVIVALFFIFREMTMLLISSNTRVSNTKTLLVDLPTLLLLILACYFAVRWLEQKDRKSALIAGGTFGLLLLLRTQSVLIMPFILLATLLVLGWKSRTFYLLTAIFFIGLVVTVTPWLVHNYLQSGKFTFDATFQYATIASQYAYTGNNEIGGFDFAGKGVGQILLEFALKDPAFVFGFISNHFLAAQINSLLALPLLKPYNGLFEPVNLYWITWDGTLEWYNLLLLIVYLGVIAMGLGSVWRRWRWIGLLPLAFSLGYALATAVGRFSGWRYDFPADWISYFYFGIGVAEILLQAALLFGVSNRWSSTDVASATYRDQKAQPKPAFPGSLILVSFFALLGALPWMAEKVAAPHYSDQSAQFLGQKISSLSHAPTPAEIDTFLSQPDSFLQIGRVLYPRFFGKNDGLSSAHPWPSYAIHDYPRIGFLLLNEHLVSVVFPTKRIDVFPHAADAIVLGCQRADHVEARLIAFPNLDMVYASESFLRNCSSASP